jgi:CheY-like chemotaxis protein
MKVSLEASSTVNPDQTRPFQLLLVEDSPSDVAMTEEAFREGGVPYRLSAADDGEMAMAFLRRAPRRARRAPI